MAQRLAAHQAGYLTACTLAAILPLDMPRSAPVQLALQGQVQRRRQLCGNCWQLVGQLGPVLPLTAVAATDLWICLGLRQYNSPCRVRFSAEGNSAGIAGSWWASWVQSCP